MSEVTNRPQAIDPPRASLWAWVSNEVREAVSHIANRADRARLEQLADDMLDLGRALEGSLRLNRRELDVVSLLSNVVSACTPHLHALGQALSVESPSGPVCIWGDGGRLVAALKALLLHAARIVREDPVLLRVRCSDTEWEMTVGDETDDADEWLSDMPDVRTPECEPLGVTLAVARHVIELHGGALELDRLGSGQFAIRLPLSGAQVAHSKRTASWFAVIN